MVPLFLEKISLFRTSNSIPQMSSSVSSRVFLGPNFISTCPNAVQNPPEVSELFSSRRRGSLLRRPFGHRSDARSGPPARWSKQTGQVERRTWCAVQEKVLFWCGFPRRNLVGVALTLIFHVQLGEVSRNVNAPDIRG